MCCLLNFIFLIAVQFSLLPQSFISVMGGFFPKSTLKMLSVLTPYRSQTLVGTVVCARGSDCWILAWLIADGQFVPGFLRKWNIWFVCVCVYACSHLLPTSSWAPCSVLAASAGGEVGSEILNSYEYRGKRKQHRGKRPFLYSSMPMAAIWITVTAHTAISEKRQTHVPNECPSWEESLSLNLVQHQKT